MPSERKYSICGARARYSCAGARQKKEGRGLGYVQRKEERSGLSEREREDRPWTPARERRAVVKDKDKNNHHQI